MRSRDMFKSSTILYLLRCGDDLLGAQRHLLYLIEHFVEKFKRVVVATNNVPYVDEFEKRGAEWRYLPVESNFDFVRGGYRLAKIISSEKVDIVHSHHRYMTSLAYWVTRFYPTKLVHTAHGVFYDKKALSFLGHNIIAVSSGVKENLIRYLGVKDSNVEVIHNGFSPLRVNEARLENLKAELDGGEDFVTMACVGELQEAKGHIYLLRALAAVLGQQNKVRVLIVGDGLLKNLLVAEAGDLGISDQVVFLGFREDVPEILTCVDFVVLPSLREGFPLVLLESLSLGTPVIATDVGGVNDLVVDGKTGVLVKSAQVEELARAILYFVENPSVRRKMGKIGKSYVEDKFSLNSMLRKTGDFYARVLGG